MHARYASSSFPVRETRVANGAGDEEAFETKASPPAVAGPLVSQEAPGHQRQGPATPENGRSNTLAGYGAPAKTGQPRPANPPPVKPDGILLDLMTGTQTLHDSLELLAAASARAVVRAGGPVVECGVVLHQPKRTPAITGTSPEVLRLLEWEQESHEGPVSEVLIGEQPVAVLQRSGDFRWPRYCRQLQLANLGSVLSFRLGLEYGVQARDDGTPIRPTRAVLAFFAQNAKAFPLQVIPEAKNFAGLAAKSLQMALDLHTARSTASDLRMALDSRTSINVACGVIMAQNRCSYHEAFSILAKASSHRNIKVRRVAEDILERLPEGAPRSHFGH